jgi:hypothetical protein
MVDGGWVNFLMQKIGEVSIFVTAEIKILQFKCIKINFRPYLRQRYVLTKNHEIPNTP